MALINCVECGHGVSSAAAACPHCGHPIRNTVAVPRAYPQRTRSTAALLALFLGGIGVHKFYVGRPGMGIIYAMFCWTFIPAIIALLEALHYAFMSDADFQAGIAANFSR